MFFFTHDEQKIQNEGKILNSKCNIASKDQLKVNDLIRLILTKLSDMENWRKTKYLAQFQYNILKIKGKKMQTGQRNEWRRKYMIWNNEEKHE